MQKLYTGITWRYYVYSFLSGLTFYTAVLIPFYTRWGHISLLQVQFLQAWLMFWTLVLEIPTGVIADKFGRKYSVTLGSFIICISFFIYGTLPDFTVFLVAEFLAAFGIALISGAGEALLYDSLKEEKKDTAFKNVFGRSFSIGQIASMISASIGGFIAIKYGLNFPMILTAIPALLASLIIITVKEPLKKISKSNRYTYVHIARNGITSFIHNKTLRIIACNGIFVYTGVFFCVVVSASSSKYWCTNNILWIYESTFFVIRNDICI
jgi:MFS family permease